MGRFAVVMLLPDSAPGRADFIAREFDSFYEIGVMLDEVDDRIPAWQAVTFCHVEDLPLLMEPGAGGG